ncbi:DUF4214 domain-containing protein [Undibacterium sp. LX40W]|uniref:DUF4214 domain-containing protein n=1 Tax=Undibacterium nitidum TaxID=2762298 RepID=A0A923HRH9_9BURK|nr:MULTISPECIES: DUF4214 domain-containing protein [Undibacterium]MBC3881960.1 DUF4214 domain-containing protein [Undibacterium nitidum]MBC3892044.1 DUF4214 domain-containing protein [Undibacterium sp. LX40W]
MTNQFKNYFVGVAISLAMLLSGCGGGSDSKEAQKAMNGPPSPSLDSTTEVFPGIRSNYTISRTATGFVVTDVGIGGGTTTINLPKTRARFADVTVNLLVGDKSTLIPPAKLKSLIELYIAFFNRVPDADGMSYWIDQIKGGMTLEQLADNFYKAAILYSNLTGYSDSMSDADFVRIIYKNVLGRSEVDQEGLNYWTSALAKPAGSIGAQTRSSLINTILNSAHSFKGDSQYGWVADLIDNKIEIATFFSIQQGLSFNTAEESISKGMEIASAVTFLDISQAKGKLSSSESTLDLRLAASTTSPNLRRTTIRLQSDAGDLQGAGQAYAYDQTNAKIEVSTEKNKVVIRVSGDETWIGVFQTGGSEQSELKPGVVTDANSYYSGLPWNQSAVAWYGETRYCFNSKGWFSIDNIKYSGLRLTEFSLRFERRCNGGAAALHGQIKFYADDSTTPPPPVLPIPATLWKPPSDLANSIGNYAYFESENNDYVGLGKTYRYDQRSTSISVQGSVSNLVITVKGNELWTAELRGMDTPNPKLTAGYYPGTKGSRFHNVVKGGLSWTGEGRGCSKSSGWFAIDHVKTDVYDSPLAFDLRFEQHCEDRAAALHGVIHWVKPDTSQLSPITSTSAVGSWRPPSNEIPNQGNYLYIQSDLGESIAKGMAFLQTSSTAKVEAYVQDNTLIFEVRGVHNWRGNFIARSGQNQFVRGEYPNMSGYPSSVGVDGSLSISGDGYSNNDPRGWLVIDHVSYVGGKLVAVDLRFEQLGLNALGFLHGQLHWRAEQTNNFAGPVLPAPNTFWRPKSGRTPSIGNYIYLESDRSDFVGDQDSYLYTPLDSISVVQGDGNAIEFRMNGDESWNGRFVTMDNLKQIQVGYYAGLDNLPYGNPAKGSFNLGGNGHGCNNATSGVIVDKVTYVSGQLTEIDLRFEQHCENEPGALRGEIHWSASDLRKPAGPTSPIPSNLWRAPKESLPSGGNYLYISSEPDDLVGNRQSGITALMTSTDTTFLTSTTPIRTDDAFFQIWAQSSNGQVGSWNGAFQAMVGVKQFQVGFYDRTMRYPFQNFAFGGLTWTANGSACNVSIGWFAIDKVTYVENKLTSIHARFEQHCEYRTAALRGELNWEASPSTGLGSNTNQAAPPVGLRGESLLGETSYARYKDRERKTYRQTIK